MDRWRSNQQQHWSKQNWPYPHWTQTLVIGLIVILAIVFCESGNLAVAAGTEITVYRDPACGCCKGWISHLQAQGFQVNDIATSEMAAIKQQHGITEALSSCHTGLIDGYAIEGHVPAKDISRLVAEHPAIDGITVPGMPIGTPGMEDGDRHDSFTVYSFGEDGVQPWAHYAF